MKTPPSQVGKIVLNFVNVLFLNSYRMGIITSTTHNCVLIVRLSLYATPTTTTTALLPFFFARIRRRLRRRGILIFLGHDVFKLRPQRLDGCELVADLVVPKPTH